MKKYKVLIIDDYTDDYCDGLSFKNLTIMEALRLIEQSCDNGYQTIIELEVKEE